MADVPYLALLQLPVRCSICLERFHVGYRTSLRMLSEQRSRSFLVMEAHMMQEKQGGASNDVHRGMIETE